MKVKAKILDYLFFQEGPGVRNTQYTTSGVKLLNVSNLVDGQIDLSNSDRYISEEEANGKYKHFLVDEGDLIIASSGIKVDYLDKKIGFIKKEHLPLCMNTSTIRFKVLDDNILNIKYFKYYLQSNDFKYQVSRSITGSAQLNYGPSHLKQMTFILYDLNKQKEIVKKLDKINSLIQKYRKVLDYLDTLIKARFVEMFGDPVLNNYQWEVKKLKDLSVLITNGTTPDGGDKNYTNNGIMFSRSQNIWKNRMELDEVVYISEEMNNNMKKSQVQHNDILITKTGRINTENSSLGRAALFEGKNNCANINGHVYLVRLNKSVLPKFVLTILIGDEYREYIRKVCVGGIDKRQINIEQVENFPIILPDIKTQEKFCDFVQHIDKLKFGVQKSLEKTQMLFDSLMQEFFG